MSKTRTGEKQDVGRVRLKRAPLGRQLAASADVDTRRGHATAARRAARAHSPLVPAVFSIVSPPPLSPFRAAYLGESKRAGARVPGNNATGS